jgi:hypothetical protein
MDAKRLCFGTYRKASALTALAAIVLTRKTTLIWRIWLKDQ